MSSDEQVAAAVVSAAVEWGRLGSQLRGRGLSAEQVDTVLAAGERVAVEATTRIAAGGRGEVVYVDADGQVIRADQASDSAETGSVARAAQLGMDDAVDDGWDDEWVDG